MASIPIADFASVPKVPGPVLNDARGPRVDLSGAARNLMTPTIDEGSFDGGAKALQSIGNGLGNLSQGATAALKDWQDIKIKGQDEIAAATLTKARYDTMDALQPELLRMNPGERAAYVETKFAPIRDLITSGAMSPARREFEQAKQIEWEAGTLHGVRSDATIDAFKQGAELALQNFSKALDKGDEEGAFSGLAGARKANLIDEATYQKAMQAGMVQVDTRDAYIHMGADPVGFQKAMAEAVKTGKSKEYPNLQPDDFLRFEGQARNQINVKKSDTLDSIKSGIANASITTMDQIKEANKASGKIFDDAEIASLTPMLNKYRPVDWGTYANVQTEVANYDPTSDPSGEQAVKLKMKFRTTLPDAQADELDSQLSAIRSSGKAENPSVREGISVINQQFNLGFFGDFKDSKLSEEKKISMYATASRVRAEKIDALRQWVKTNPKASSAQISEYLNGALTPERTLNGASIMNQTKGNNRIDYGSGRYVPGLGTAIPLQTIQQRPSAVDEAKKKLESKPSASLSSEGYIPALATTFGYKDKEDNGVGAWGHKTNNPDIMGASLPIAFLREHFGDENKAKDAIVEVRNPDNGKVIRVPIVDKGPADWVVARQGMTIDLTHAANKAIGATGKTKVEFKIVENA